MSPRAKRWLVRTIIVLTVSVLMLFAVGWVVMSQPQFGARMTGARLERARANSQYRDGPFDIAFIKIGAYGPGAAWVDIHMPPEQAVQVNRDVRETDVSFALVHLQLGVPRLG
jgi:hypothetical protein